jgi:DNA repair and recombination protein RAD54B
MDNIQDDVLQKLLVTHKTARKNTPHQALTQLDQLSFTVDLDNIRAENDALTVKEVPGGSVSFIFQRNSSAQEPQDRVAREKEDLA